MNSGLGSYIREVREARCSEDRRYSLRQVAGRIGVQPSFLSQVERGLSVSISEDKLKAIADDLGIDRDVLLALAGRVSSDLQEIIRKRPQLLAQLLRELREMPDHAVVRVVREVRDGDW